MHRDRKVKKLAEHKGKIIFEVKIKVEKERERDDNWLVLIHAEIDMDNVKELEKLQWQKYFETRAHA